MALKEAKRPGGKFATVGELLERVSRVSKRHHEMQNEQSLSFATFKRLMEQMGLVVLRFVDADTLATIELEWGKIQVDYRPGD